MSWSSLASWPRVCGWALGVVAGCLQAAEPLQLTFHTDDLALIVSGPLVGKAVVYESRDLQRWTPVYAFFKTEGEERISILPTNAVRYFMVVQTNYAVPEGFVWIPAGEYVMGSAPDEVMRREDEGPQRPVEIRRGFWMCQYEVTVRDFEQFMPGNPSAAPSGSLRPVENVTWQEAMDYCRYRTRDAQVRRTIPPATRFRLPSEAEWEYACRAGTTTRYSFGDDPTFSLSMEYGWRAANSSNATHEVGLLLPNPWGLYDIHGNVFEWCLDLYGPYPGAEGIPVSNVHVFRGGSWICPPDVLRCACRHPGGIPKASYIGFRVLLGTEPDTVVN